MKSVDAIVTEALSDLDVNSPEAVGGALQRIREGLAQGDEILRLLVILKVKSALKGKVEGKVIDLALAPTPPEQPTQKPWPDDKPSDGPVNLASLLEEMRATFERHIILPEGAAVALSLWVAHTYAFDSFPISPYLGVMSPTRGCGKTTLFQILKAFASKAFSVTNATAATIFRVIEKWHPTILLDEGDTFLPNNEQLRGILDGGHAKTSAFVIRTTGDDFEPTFFSTWGPKAFALIGRLPPTLEDRSVRILLKRKTRKQQVEPVDEEALAITSSSIRSALLRWSQDKRVSPLGKRPTLPTFLENRAADNWRVLIAIADDAGEDWAKRGRQAAELLQPAPEEDEDIVTMLLRDLREIFKQHGPELYTEEVIGFLTADENRPWREFDRSGEITANKLSRLLKDFGIRSQRFRRQAENRWGYRAAWFADVFAAYFPEPEQTEQTEQTINEADNEEELAG